MKTYPAKGLKNVHYFGRRGDEDYINLYWSSSGALMRIRAGQLDVTIDASCNSSRHYISFEIDGLRAQTFAPLDGVHTYTVFSGMDSKVTHTVRIIKETQVFSSDSYVHLLSFSFEGRLMKLPAFRRRLEFIGDSVTSGEGARGPVDFTPWVPMVFTASDCYARLTADKLKADYNVISVSGWGVRSAWNNVPEQRLPRIYDKTYYDCPQQLTYDFSLDPDTVVVALGANDNSAMSNPEYVNPQTGEHFKQHDTPEDKAKLTADALAFIKVLHEKNPSAHIVWLILYKQGTVHDAIQSAVKAAADEGIPVTGAAVFDFDHMTRSQVGARMHPGALAHKQIAKALIKLIK